jgi:hypothetical protein
VRSLMPKRAKTAARKAKGADWRSKVRAYGFLVLGGCSPWRKSKTTYQIHSLSYDEHQRLVGNGGGRGEEEKAQGDVEEGDGANDRAG